MTEQAIQGRKKIIGLLKKHADGLRNSTKRSDISFLKHLEKNIAGQEKKLAKFIQK